MHQALGKRLNRLNQETRNPSKMARETSSQAYAPEEIPKRIILSGGKLGEN